MTPNPVMPKQLQIDFLKRIYKGTANFSWEHEVDSTLSLPENRIALSIKFPNGWFADEIEAKDVKNEAIKEYHEYLDYLLESAVLPEAREGMRPIFEKALSDYRYRMERNLERATLRKTIKKLEEQLLEAKRMGKPQKDIIEEEKRKLKAPPEPRPPAFTSTLEKKLRDVFSASLTREGLSPTKFLSEYRVELENIRTLPTEDEMVRAVEALAGEITLREQARKIRPPRLRAEGPPSERIYRPRPGFRDEEEEEEGEWGRAPGAAPLYPPRSMSEMPFPRLPAGIELDLIKEKFLYDLPNCGIYAPALFLPQFEKNFAQVLFRSWDAMRQGYDTLVEQICKGLEAKYPAQLRALPYESIEDGVYWLVSQKRFESAEEIAAELHELGTPTTAEEVRRFIRIGYEQKVPNFVIVTRDYLEKLLGEPLY